MRRIWLVALVLAAPLTFPALASAAQSFAVSAANGGAPNFPAGSDPSYTTTENLDSGHMGPGKVTIKSAAGVLASLAANPSCLTGSAQYAPACQIGTGSASAGGLPVISTTAYLAPPPPQPSGSPPCAAGIDLVSNPGNSVTHVCVTLQQTASGNVQSVLNFDLSGLGTVGSTLTQLSLTVSGTLNNKPFTRMPTNCSVTDHSTLKITYIDGTTETSTASPDFTPTGCDQLPFNPSLSASAVKDPHDPGVMVVTTQTQALGEAAGESTTLQLPWPALTANTNSLSIQNTNTAVGTAVATSPLQPTPLTGNAYLTGAGPFTPTLTLKFPALGLTLVGTVDLNAHTVTFSNLPDVPQTSLVVTLFGGTNAAESTTCAPPGGIAHGTFTGQNGKAVSVSTPLTISGCPSAPSISHATLSGLASGKPALRFKLTRGSDAPSLKSIAVSLPGGLSFNRKKLAKGVSVGARHTLRLQGGTLVITLNPPAVSASVAISSSALVESKQLQKQERRHAVAAKHVQITVADADGSSHSFVASG